MTAPADERLRAELRLIRASVTGVYGSLVATSDGFLVVHDIPDLEPTAIAALVATTRSLASRTTQSAGRGRFREAIARGSHGYVAVYAAGTATLLAVIGTAELNIGMLHYQTREMVERIAASAAGLDMRAAPPPAQTATGPAGVGQGAAPSAPGRLPVRRAAVQRRQPAG